MKNLTALIVEDDQIMRTFLQHYLSSSFEVVAVSGPFDAIKWLEEGNIPNIILTDIMMPEISGLDFIRYVRSTEFMSDIPMMVISGLSSSQDCINALDVGANDYLTKPFNPKELMARLNRLIKTKNHYA